MDYTSVTAVSSLSRLVLLADTCIRLPCLPTPTHTRLYRARYTALVVGGGATSSLMSTDSTMMPNISVSNPPTSMHILPTSSRHCTHPTANCTNASGEGEGSCLSPATRFQ